MAIRDLDDILVNITATISPHIYAFVTSPNTDELSSLDSIMSFRESEGTTVVSTLTSVLAAGLDYQFPCRMISLDVHSDLQAVGLLAIISKEIAARHIPVNVVSAFFHDHLFVPEDRAEEVLSIIQALSSSSS